MIHSEKSRTALITGAASGIGAAIALELRSRGVRVIGLDRIRVAGCDEALVCDVGDGARVSEAIHSVGYIDIAVTAAGYYGTTDIFAVDPAAWQEMLRVHVEGTANVIAAVLPAMLERRSGAICTIASELALVGDAAAPHYAAAKGAVIALTQAVPGEAAPYGVSINTLLPGPCDTPLLPAEHRTAEAIAALPLRRLLQPHEIASTAAWLVLDGANIIGQMISPNAGAVL